MIKMKTKKNRTKRLLELSDSAYLWIIAFFTLIIMAYNFLVGAIGAILLAVLIYYHVKANNYRKRAIAKYIEGLSNEFDYITQDAVFNLPVPLALIRPDNKVSWYNPKFKEMVGSDDILGIKVNSIIEDFQLTLFEDKKIPNERMVRINHLDKAYKVMYNWIAAEEDDGDDSTEESKVLMTYWIDDTDHMNMSLKHEDEKANIGIIQIDNYEDVINGTDELLRPLLVAKIEQAIKEFGSEIEAAVRRYDKGKYLLVFENRYLRILEERKFDIIDIIRDIEEGNDLPVTISLGIGIGGSSINETFEYSKAAIDISLGRGGDQVVVKNNEKLSFYGGKTKTLEKRTKVKARVIAHALKQLIDQSEEVFIMGHKVPDMDCFGAAIGIYRAVKTSGKKGYIVLDGINPAIENIYYQIKEESPELFKAIISPEEAIYRAKKEALCVIVDIHRPSRVEVPELLEIIDRRVIIDHHRRASEFVEDPILLYLEPYASSTCELVTEILVYFEEKIKMDKVEAEALLSGIIVDTKYFTFNTGVRTFEAASFLRRAGADTTDVRQLFQDSIGTVKLKAKLTQGAEIILDKIAIAAQVIDSKDAVLVAAQTADDLLKIKGIAASFVIIEYEERIHISGRSYGDINVQLVLEKLGGGGHLTVAGAQLSEVSLEEAKEILVDAVTEYIREGDDD